MGAWANARLKALPQETRIAMWNRYIAGEYGGMNEAMARLFRLSGDRRFIETAKLFDNTTLFYGNAAHEGGLAKKVDTIRGKHANQHIPQITGALETFRNTREMPYYQIASNFWNIVNDSYMYSIGGVAGARNPNNAECFPVQPGTLWENGILECLVSCGERWRSRLSRYPCRKFPGFAENHVRHSHHPPRSEAGSPDNFA